MRQIAVLYARVSTSNQEEEATIESQIAAIEQYIKDKNYELPEDYYFLDQAVSGAYLERPALDNLRHLAVELAFSVMVCYSPDRLSRRYAHQWVIIDELERQGVRVEFVNQPDLGDNPQAQLLLGVQGLFAEYERSMIKERLRLGRLYKIRTGQLMHNAPPYGYIYIPRDETGGGSYWVIYEREAEAVRQIFIWYTGKEQLTIWQITKRLNQHYPHALRKAKEWQHSTVHKILQRTAYIGRTYFNKERIEPDSLGTPRITGRGRRKTMKLVSRPKSEWIEVEVPAIIDEATWNRAQERLKLNRKFASRNNKKHFYLLRSLLVCESCGHTLQGRCQNGRIYYFCEYGGKNRYPEIPRHRSSISGNIIEPIVRDAVVDLLKNPNQILAAWETDTPKDVKPDELTRLRKRLDKLERQWVRLLDAYQDSLIDKSDLSKRKLHLDQERNALTEQIAHIQHHKAQKHVKDQVMDEFATYCDTIQTALGNPTPQVKQEVLRLLIKEIVVGDDTVTIKHIVPIDDFSRLLPRGNIQLTPSWQSNRKRRSLIVAIRFGRNLAPHCLY
jgi:site-specific DNA recombinase